MRRLAQLAILLVLTSTLCAASAFGQAGGLVNATRGFPVPNDGSTGTILNGTAKIQANGTAIIAGTGDTAVPVYIVNGGAGTTGNAVLAAAGTLAACVMDSNQTNAGAFHVVQSTTNTNECHAQSAAPASGAWTIGFLASSSTSAGQLANVWVGGFQFGSGGGASIFMSVPTELLVNGAGSATASSFAITKNTEQPTQAWLTPPNPGQSNIVQSNSNSCVGFTCTVTLPANVGRNDALYFQAVWSTPPAGVTLTDSLSNTFSQPSGINVIWYVCSSPNSGAETFTLSWSSPSAGVAISAMEMNGVNTSSCIDQDGQSSSTSVTTSGSVTSATELVVGAWTNIGSVGTGVALFQAGTGYTQVTQLNTGGGGGRLTTYISTQNQTTSLSGTQTATVTDVGSTLSLSGFITTFKLTTTGQYIPFFRTITMPYLPVTTFTPGNNDCVNWSVTTNGTQFGDSGLPCLGSGANGLSAGSVTLSGGTGSHNFTAGYANAPICVATDTTAANVVKATSTTAAVSLTGTGTDVLNWVCTPAVN